jgi:hypothetical protein
MIIAKTLTRRYSDDLSKEKTQQQSINNNTTINQQQHMVTTHSLTSASLVTVSKPMQSHSAFHKRQL